jgi:hypothetical protein
MIFERLNLGEKVLFNPFIPGEEKNILKMYSNPYKYSLRPPTVHVSKKRCVCRTSLPSGKQGGLRSSPFKKNFPLETLLYCTGTLDVLAGFLRKNFEKYINDKKKKFDDKKLGKKCCL